MSFPLKSASMYAVKPEQRVYSCHWTWTLLEKHTQKIPIRTFFVQYLASLWPQQGTKWRDAKMAGENKWVNRQEKCETLRKTDCRLDHLLCDQRQFDLLRSSTCIRSYRKRDPKMIPQYNFFRIDDWSKNTMRQRSVFSSRNVPLGWLTNYTKLCTKFEEFLRFFKHFPSNET